MPTGLLSNLKTGLRAQQETGNNLDTFQIVPVMAFSAKFIIGTIHLFVTLHYRKAEFIILLNKKLSSHQRKETIQETQNRSDSHISQLNTINKS
jgi:hypothetical protein